MFFLYTLNSARVAKAYLEHGAHVRSADRNKLMLQAMGISKINSDETFFISEKGNLHDTRDGKPLTREWSTPVTVYSDNFTSAEIAALEKANESAAS